VLRLCDLLAVAVEDSRQGADPRLPLELALVKVTRPGSDLSRESLAFRVEQLEQRGGTAAPAATAAAPAARPADAPQQPTPIAPQPTPEQAEPAQAPPLALDQLQDAWQRSVLPAVQERSIPVASLLGEARPSALAGETLTLEFPATADFHRRQAEEPKNVGVIRDALYEVTGHRLAVLLELGEAADADAGEEDEAVTEDTFITMFKDTFDAQEVEETR
jgi:DNA polymerase-3 subunit gamma/tau